MAKEYIEREALQEIFENRMQDDNVMCPVIKVLDVLEIIEKAPAANVIEVKGNPIEPQRVNKILIGCGEGQEAKEFVPVVRCKECKYWKAHDGMIEANVCYATFDYHGRERITAPTDFCSYGERKEK